MPKDPATSDLPITIHLSNLKLGDIIILLNRFKARSVSKLTNKLYHNTSRSMDVYIEKLNRYASLQAKDYEKHTSKLTPYHFVIKPAWTFFKHYIIQSGFRDGFIGLTISYLR